MNTFELDHRTTTKDFREAVLKHLPALRDNKPYLRLFLLLTLCAFPDRVGESASSFNDPRDLTGRVVLDRHSVAECEEQQAVLASEHYCARDLLDRFQDDTGLDLQLSKHHAGAGRARTADPIFPPALHQLIDRERRTLYVKRRHCSVRFVSGGTAQQDRQRRAAKRLHQAHVSRCLQAYREELAHASPYTLRLLEFINHDTGLFVLKLLERNERAARAAVERLTVRDQHGQMDTVKTARLREHAHNILSALADQPATVYAGSEKVPRAFAQGLSLVNLPREVRQALTAGCDEYDLSNSQYAIACKVLDMPLGQALLKSGDKLWDRLCRDLNLVRTRAKPVIKPACYSTLYGDNLGNVTRKLAHGNTQHFGLGLTVARQLVAHPLWKEIWTTRDRALKQLKTQGYGDTCLGVRYTVGSARDARAVLCAQMQSWELLLLIPALDILERYRDRVHIVAWQHDGLCIHCTDAKLRTSIRKQLEQAVKQEANKHGIVTGLEHKTLENVPDVLDQAA